MNEINLSNLKEHFQNECKVINLKFEYEAYTGEEQWAVITELSEKELFEKYPDIISHNIPFVLLSVEQGKAVYEFRRNESKFYKRYLPSHIILGEKFGLKEPSMVMLEQLKTVNQSELVEYIGFVDNEYLLRKVNHGLKKALGLWVDKPQKHKGDIE